MKRKICLNNHNYELRLADRFSLLAIFNVIRYVRQNLLCKTRRSIKSDTFQHISQWSLCRIKKWQLWPGSYILWRKTTPIFGLPPWKWHTNGCLSGTFCKNTFTIKTINQKYFFALFDQSFTNGIHNGTSIFSFFNLFKPEPFENVHSINKNFYFCIVNILCWP